VTAAAGKRGGAKPGPTSAGAGAGKKKGVVDQDAISDPGVKPRAQSGRNGAGLKLPQVVKKTRPASMHDAPKDSAAAAAGRKVEKRTPAAAASAARGGGGDQASGFKKLQMGINAKKGGPVVVTFEEEEEMHLLKGKQIAPTPPGAHRGGGGGGAARQSHLPVPKGQRGHGHQQEELRGASEHLSIPSADMDGISDDQLDRLLVRARNARN
jgi:hypothetical protein